MSRFVSAVVLVCNDEYWLPWALEASRGSFDRYVIYDIGSKDRTKEIIAWFKGSNKEASFYIRFLDMQLPVIQGIFRNSMIAEALSECYFILDGDEIWIDGTCYHFHNCERSSYDSEVPKRIERRARATYRPGQKQSIEILKELPILEKNICDFKRNPALQKLINDK